MTRSLLIVVASGALVAAVIGPVYGVQDALVTAGLVSALAAASLLAAHRLARGSPQRPLRARFDLVVGTAVGVILVGVITAAELMFVSNHDALLVSAIALGAAVVALRAARVASADLVQEVGEVTRRTRIGGRGRADPAGPRGGGRGAQRPGRAPSTA